MKSSSRHRKDQLNTLLSQSNMSSQKTMQTESTHAVNGLILAGGLARRMGGQDKGLLQLQGSSLTARCVLALSPHVSQIYISANRNITEYEKFGLPVLQDDNKDFDGPLAGIQCALKASADKPVLVVPCDAPLLEDLLAHDLLESLLNTLKENDCVAAIPHDGTRLQPLFGLYAPNALSSLNDYLASGQRKVETWVNTLTHVVVDFSSHADEFMNINTENDLQRAALFISNRK